MTSAAASAANGPDRMTRNRAPVARANAAPTPSSAAPACTMTALTTGPTVPGAYSPFDTASIPAPASSSDSGGNVSQACHPPGGLRRARHASNAATTATTVTGTAGSSAQRRNPPVASPNPIAATSAYPVAIVSPSPTAASNPPLTRLAATTPTGTPPAVPVSVGSPAGPGSAAGGRTAANTVPALRQPTTTNNPAAANSPHGAIT